MCWSIYLSGPKKLVIAELRHAATSIYHAIEVAEGVSDEQLSISASGHSYKRDDGSFSGANSFTVDGIAPPQAVAVQEVAVQPASTPDKPDYPF